MGGVGRGHYIGSYVAYSVINVIPIRLFEETKFKLIARGLTEVAKYVKNAKLLNSLYFKFVRLSCQFHVSSLLRTIAHAYGILSLLVSNKSSRFVPSKWNLN